MKVNEINFYSDFNCIMGECPNTCCRNWVIMVDDDTYGNYLMEPGLKGIRLRNGIEKHGDAVTIKKKKGTCPFFSSDGKCGLQLKGDVKFMPEVCKVFPRYRVNYGPFAEECLFLSCPEAARLFVEGIDEFSFVTVNKDIDYAKWVTNDDEEYLSDVLKYREDIFELISDKTIPRDVIYTVLYDFAKDLQVFYTEGGEKPALSDYVRKIVDENESGDFLNGSGGNNRFKLTAEITDKLITKGLYHSQLKKTGPLLYDLFREYFKLFDKLTIDDAEKYARTLRDGMFSSIYNENQFVERVLRAYLKYYFCCEFLYVYEDYSFLKNICIGVVQVHMLELLFSIYYEKYGKLDKEDVIKVIYSYDRRGNHNQNAEEMFYDVIKEQFMSLMKGET